MNKRLIAGMVVVLALMVSLVGSGVTLAKGPTEDAEFVADEILVKFEPGTPAADIAKINRSQGARVKSEIPQIGVLVLKVPSGKVLDKVAAYEKNPNVVYAEPNYIRVLAPPDDAISGTPYGFDDQWALNNTGQTGGTADADIDWLEAYDALTANSPVIIAVNDSGIDSIHSDLNDKLLILPGSDIIDGDDDPSDDPANPVYGHGTHTAGIAAAETNNGEGVAGVAFGTATQIMPVRIFDKNASTTIEAIVGGLVFAADNGADVINMSYGGTQRSKAERDAVKYAWSSGAVLVAAAGNLGEYINAATWKNYPAAYDEVMAVSATTHSDTLAYYSSHGNWLSVAAPGGDMSETFLGGILSTYPESWYAWWSGTSMAAPHVSGLAGLLFVQDPTRSNSEVRSIIEATADDLGDAGFDGLYGYGRVNAYAAIQYGSPPATGSTSGMVINADTLDPIGGATVTADGYETTTAGDGTYTLADIPVGSYTVTASATGYVQQFKNADVQENDTTVVDFALDPEPPPPPPGGVDVTGIDPDTMQAGTEIGVTITGSGFVAGTDVTFENGRGPAPTVSNINVVDANTITATVTAKSGGPPRNRVWDVRVTNPDGATDVLVNGFTVTP